MASKKTTWPGALVDYSGWSVCGASRSICLSPKGWLSLVAVVEIDLGEGVSHVSYTVLERSVHILRHYASICPVAEAFTASLWHALRAVPRGAARIDLTSCRTDIRWWGSLLRAALGDPSVFSWSTAAIAGLLRPSVTVESDASGWGGGLIMVGAHTAAYKFAFTGAERAGSPTSTWPSTATRPPTPARPPTSTRASTSTRPCTRRDRLLLRDHVLRHQLPHGHRLRHDHPPLLGHLRPRDHRLRTPPSTATRPSTPARPPTST